MRTKGILGLALAALFGLSAQAASISTTATLSGTAALAGTGVTASGTGNMTNIGAVTWTATASIGATAISGPVTITVTSGGTLTGTITLPTSILLGTSSNSSASVVITGGTGTYAGSTGTLSGNGTGSIGATGAISLTFTGSGTINTSGGGTTNPIPTISAVLDAASYTPSIAQGSIFVVKGTNLSASGFIQNSGFPLSTTLSNVKITFTPTGGAAGTDCYMIYLYNQGGVNQLAALLPSTVAAGSYSVVVNNNGTAGPGFSVTVVKSKVGLITRNSAGTGLSVIQNYVSGTQIDIDAYTSQNVGGVSLSAGFPGETMVAYGTGFGAVPGAADNTASAGYNFAANGHTVIVILGGTNITPAYAGRTPGSAGLDQINYVLPANVPTGCAVTMQISYDGVLSPVTTVSIAPAQGQPCVQPGFTTAQLSQFDQGVSYNTSAFTLLQYGLTVSGFGSFKYDSLGGDFLQYSGFDLAAIASSGQITTIQSGACTVSQATGSSSGSAGGTATHLDAGTVTATGPSGSNINGPMTFSSTTGYTFGAGIEGGATGIPLPTVNYTIVPGTYKISGAGGKDVGSFNTSVSLGSPLTVTGGLPTSVTRGSGLTVSFTGGNPSDTVELIGGSTSGSGASTTSVSFYCVGTAGAGQIVVAPAILNLLPASSQGTLIIESGPVATYTAPLTAGGTINGAFGAFSGTMANPVTYK
jgi:uncharacterized protein (TIGR03437 family)